MITVKLFALLREKAGTSELILHAPPATVEDMIRIVGDRCPGIKDMLACGRILVSVNQEFVKQNAPLKDGDEIGLMPPFSGGQERHGIVRIQEGPFSLDAEIARIKMTSQAIGGVVTFLGTTRDVSRHGKVAKLEFEHYAGMAERTLAGIRERAIDELKVIDVTIIHRVGTMPVGADIVLIVAAAEHREEAFNACRFCIDELKRITPIWKKETTPDGVIWVEEHP